MAVHARGKVTRLYTSKNYVAIRLATPPDEVEPLSGYYMLRTTHPNYNALYSLALAAAVNGVSLTIRTEQEITPQATAEVWYFVADWPSA